MAYKISSKKLKEKRNKIYSLEFGTDFDEESDEKVKKIMKHYPFKDIKITRDRSFINMYVKTKKSDSFIEDNFSSDIKE